MPISARDGMTELAQHTVTAVTLGCIVGLVALGWVVVYRVSGVLNLAQGSFVVVGALTFTALSQEHGLPVLPSAAVAIATCVTSGVAIDVVALRRLSGTGNVAPIIVTLGAAELLAEGARQVFGPDAVLHRPFFDTAPIDVFGVTVQRQTLLIWGATALLGLGLWALFDRTLLGKALQACANDPDGAALSGISPRRMPTLAFGLAAGLGGAGGVLLAPQLPIAWDGGIGYGLRGFTAATLGGWSYGGAIAGAASLGGIESYSAAYIDSTWKDAVVMGVLLAVLITRSARASVRDWHVRRRFARQPSHATRPITTSLPTRAEIPTVKGGSPR
jgi:branched-chain amino acid transport system permease protein